MFKFEIRHPKLAIGWSYLPHEQQYPKPGHNQGH